MTLVSDAYDKLISNTFNDISTGFLIVVLFISLIIDILLIFWFPSIIPGEEHKLGHWLGIFVFIVLCLFAVIFGISLLLLVIFG